MDGSGVTSPQPAFAGGTPLGGDVIDHHNHHAPNSRQPVDLVDPVPVDERLAVEGKSR
jgi:hypothetical protein